MLYIMQVTINYNKYLCSNLCFFLFKSLKYLNQNVCVNKAVRYFGTNTLDALVNQSNVSADADIL